jgi:hypothetical protein
MGSQGGPPGHVILMLGVDQLLLGRIQFFSYPWIRRVEFAIAPGQSILVPLHDIQ